MAGLPTETFQEAGKVDREEMYRVFNMGIGYVYMVRAKDLDASMKILKAQRARPVVIGQVEKGSDPVRFTG